MDKETIERILELQCEIAKLPKGLISDKTIKGRVYFYHQWSEKGKRHTRYVPESELVPLFEALEKRDMLKKELNDLKWRHFSAKENTKVLPYVLMHLNDEVLDLAFDGTDGTVSEIGRLINAPLLPIGTATSYGKADAGKLKTWWRTRAIPGSRSGIGEVLETLGVSSTALLLTKAYGLSLSDCYWIKPRGSTLSWEQINFFDNSFSEDLGKLLLLGKGDRIVDFSSPDSTSVGNLKKRWKISDGKRFLVKGGSAPYRQEPINEALASVIADHLGLPHVPYDLVFQDGYPYSVCPDFVDGKVEFVPAAALVSLFDKRPNEPTFDFLIRACQRSGITDVRPFLEKMIAFDYLIANEDRHTHNFGFLRDAKTLYWIGPAPLFDNGSSFGFDKLNDEISNNVHIISKPFRSEPEKQLGLLSSSPFSQADLDHIPLLAKRFLEEHINPFMDEVRIRAICKGLQTRIVRYKELFPNE